MPNPNHIYPNDRCVHGVAALLAFPVSCTHSEAVVQMVWLAAGGGLCFSVLAGACQKIDRCSHSLTSQNFS